LSLYEQKKIGHIRHGAQRRERFPFSVGMVPSAQTALDSSEFDIQRQMYTCSNGEQLFCQVLKSTKVDPKYVLVFIHGIFGASDLFLGSLCHLARQGAVVVMPDLPGHGRSDGLLGYIADWFDWINQVWELLDIVVPPMRDLGSKGKLRVFCMGMSLGGGVTTCLGMQRPNFFDGLVIVAPSLGVADDVKPPKIVQDVFVKVLGPWRLTAPCAPAKEIAHFDFRVPEQGMAYISSNPVGMQGLPVRLSTGKEVAFAYPEWVQAHFQDMKVPFVVLHGKEDRITEPEQSQSLYDKASSQDKTIKLYDGAYHAEMLQCLPGNEQNIAPSKWLPEQLKQTELVLKDISEWLTARA
jgi:acylglycerol lipase